MVLSVKERGLVQSLWIKIAPRSRELGAEVFKRMFVTYPQTKAFYPNLDLSDGSADLLNHGEKMFNALGNAVSNLKNHDKTPSSGDTDSDLFAKNLNVDPGNFQYLSDIIQGVLTDHFPNVFTSKAKAAWNKFLSEVSTNK